MPSREEAWRNQYWLHVVFAVSSVAMLVSIVWMMAEDHLREWKEYQRGFLALEEQQNADKLKAAESEQFKQKLTDLNQRIEQAEADLADNRIQVRDVQSRIDAQDVVVKRLDLQFKFARADRDVARANYGLAIRDGLDQAALDELKHKAEVLRVEVAALQLQLEEETTKLDAAKGELAEFTSARDALQEEIDEFTRDVENLRTTYEQRRLTATKRILNLPILDAFNAPLEIKQIWLPDVKIDYGGMASVARFDRCTTCHLGIDRSETGGVPAFPASQYEQPFATHPRLDLFAGATSPHPTADFGCTICHDGQGSSTSFLYASHTPDTPKQGEAWTEEHGWQAIHHWDFPQLPKRFLEATCVKCHHDVVELETSRQFGNAAPKLVEGYNLVRQYGCFGCHEINGFDGPRRIGPDLRLEPNDPAVAHQLGAYPTEESGIMRKVGPSLRHLAEKITKEWTYHWTQEPKAFRPNTRMPQFFGNSNQQDETAKKFMPIEVRGVVEYLFSKGLPLAMDDTADALEGNAQRGKRLFEQRGCLACHTHETFPDAENTFGPNLSKIKAKLKPGKEGFDWLVTWLREPTRHSPRTRMPNTQLDPTTDADGTPYDPAVDIATWLLSVGDEGTYSLPDVDEEALNERAFLYLHNTMTTAEANALLENGMSQEDAKAARGDEKELTSPITTEKKLIYVGRRIISTYGCFGCHDVPGFEEAKPIGTALADWGRKDPEKLAFEHIVEYLEQHEHAAEHAGEDDDYAFYLNEITSHRRPGFAWQKLRDPRSYDHEKLGVKTYDERLRMPQFTFSLDEKENLEKIEAVVTFLLSSVASPPAEQYVYHPDDVERNRIHGERLIAKYNCASCHVLEMASYTFKADPEEVFEPSHASDFPFAVKFFEEQAGKGSTRTDDAGNLIVTMHGMLTGTDEGSDLSRKKDATEYYVDLWKPGRISESLFLPGDRLLLRSEKLSEGDKAGEEFWLESETASVGGDFAQVLVAAQLRDNPQLQPQLAWQRVPPPLVLEGEKVQTPWLFRFLRNPFPIRPITLLRMPQFNMSDAEAQVLANYFAAKDNAGFPYQEVPQQTKQFAEEKQRERDEYWGQAWQLVTSHRQACVGCHAVAGRGAAGNPNDPNVIMGPNLGSVNSRLRPDWVLRFLSNPVRIIPYTSMPQNFPPNEPNAIAEELSPGTSLEHIDAVRNVLMNYNNVFEMEVTKKETEAPAAQSGGGT